MTGGLQRADAEAAELEVSGGRDHLGAVAAGELVLERDVIVVSVRAQEPARTDAEIVDQVVD